MYRGVQVLLTGTIPTYALRYNLYFWIDATHVQLFRFGTFDYLKQVVTGGEGVLSPVQRMMCGLGAGMTEAALVVTWIETLKVATD